MPQMQRIVLAIGLAILAGCASVTSVPEKRAPAVTQDQESAKEFAWTQYAAGGAEIRVISFGDKCPSAAVDGNTIPLSERAAAEPGFPGRICSAPFPAQARQASVDGISVPVPHGPVKRILIFGDTGCRLKGRFVQDCNDPQVWPFAKIAAIAAATHPDLVIHVGDYYYRETPCPDGRSGCTGSPFGDAWPSWKADFFDPATPLLAAAPWVFARGNHEQCGRGAKGWFRFLDATPAPATCPAESMPFTVDLGDLRLFVMDSADTEDRSAPPALVDAFAKQAAALNLETGRTGWIVTHRPVWAFAPTIAGPVSAQPQLNETERTALHGHPLKAVSLVVSGHIHNFESVSFGAKRPAQLVVGSGGDTQENQSEKPEAVDGKFDGMAAHGLSFRQFGYLLFDRSAKGWTGAFYALDGSTVASCSLSGRKLDCKATK